MPRFSFPLPAHRLCVPILLPLAPLRILVKTCVHELIDFDVVDKRDRRLEERTVNDLIDALLHQWFVDPEGTKLQEFMSQHVEHPTLIGGIILELQESFHRLICNSIGTLVPSYRYRYEAEHWHDTLRITPTLPTLEDYDQRIQDLCQDGSWTPSRYRSGR
jgi:hypothetical protein